MKIQVCLEDKRINVIYLTSRVEYKKITGYDTEDYSGVCSFNDKLRTIYIGVFNGSLGVLNHELYHCMDFINQLISEFKDSYFSESNAYLSEYLFNKFKKGLK